MGGMCFLPPPNEKGHLSHRSGWFFEAGGSKASTARKEWTGNGGGNTWTVQGHDGSQSVWTPLLSSCPQLPSTCFLCKSVG